MRIRTRDECGCSLAAEVLEQSGTVRLRVSGKSMLPTLWPDDVLTIESRQLDEAELGELVLYEREGRFYVHRLISRLGQDRFITRGDCMAESDSPFPRQTFLGVVTSVSRGDRGIVPSRTRSVPNRLLAIILGEIEILQRLALHWCNRDNPSRRQALPKLRALGGGVE